jgi:hypothetical protein
MDHTGHAMPPEGIETYAAAVPHLLGYHLLRTNDGVTMRPWACPVGREGGLRVV